MHICVSLPDPSLAQALAAKEWCYKGSFVNEASRLMVEGLFIPNGPATKLHENYLFLERCVHFAFAGPFFCRKSVPQTKKGPFLHRRCIDAFFNFLSFQGQKMDFFWVSMDGARKIFKQNPAFEEAPLVDFSWCHWLNQTAVTGLGKALMYHLVAVSTDDKRYLWSLAPRAEVRAS